LYVEMAASLANLSVEITGLALPANALANWRSPSFLVRVTHPFPAARDLLRDLLRTFFLILLRLRILTSIIKFNGYHLNFHFVHFALSSFLEYFSTKCF
jgi:hypothetical protein